jgi:hypothetical protein
VIPESPHLSVFVPKQAVFLVDVAFAHPRPPVFRTPAARGRGGRRLEGRRFQ